MEILQIEDQFLRFCESLHQKLEIGYLKPYKYMITRRIADRFRLTHQTVSNITFIQNLRKLYNMNQLMW